MKIIAVALDDSRQVFVVSTRTQRLDFPYSRAHPAPRPTDPVAQVYVDAELGREGFTYRLASGAEGSVHLDSVLDVNSDPDYLARLEVYRLTLEAKRAFERSGLTIREAAKKLHTSPTQLYRVLDPTNDRKSARQLLAVIALAAPRESVVSNEPTTTQRKGTERASPRSTRTAPGTAAQEPLVGANTPKKAGPAKESLHDEVAAERAAEPVPASLAVRPSQMWFLGQERLPGWAATLVRQLRGSGAGADPELLSPVPLLDEVIAICDGKRRGYDLPRQEDRASLGADLTLALLSLGPATAKTNATKLNRLANAAPKMRDMGSLQSWVDIAKLAQDLRSDFASGPTRAAAFADCTQAFKEGASAATCELRLRQLSSFVRTSGHDWQERVRRVEDALSDRQVALLEAGTITDLDAKSLMNPAGMCLEDRLALAQDFLAAAPKRGNFVVWLAYANASVEPVYLKRGPIEFYDSRIWSAAVSGDWPGNPAWLQPPELADPEAVGCLHGVPESDFVMARVSLVEVPIHESADKARLLVSTALSSTGWKSPWIPYHGSAIYGNRWLGSFGFTAPDRPEDGDSPIFQPVTDALAGVDEELLARLSVSEPEVLDLAYCQRWRRTARDARLGEHRVSLAVALIERILSPSRDDEKDTWYSLVESQLRTLLAADDLLNQVWNVGMAAHSTLSRMPGTDRDLSVATKEIIKFGPKHSVTVRLDRLLKHSEEILGQLDPATLEGRMLAEMVRRTTDGRDVADWLAECELRFSRLLRRLQRQRNSIVHGRRTVPEVIDSVDSFADRIAGRVVGILQASVESGHPIQEELDGWRGAWEDRKSRLREGDDPGKVLF